MLANRIGRSLIVIKKKMIFLELKNRNQILVKDNIT